jgi:hypothetical protein
MDSTQLATIAVAILAPLSPYLAKAGEKVAEEVGKAIFEQGQALWSAIRLKFARDHDDEAQRTMSRFAERPAAASEALVAQVASKAESDPDFRETLDELVDETRTTLFDCLQERFRRQDLKQVYFLLGIGWDDLTGEMASRSEKAMALIEYVESRGILPELVSAMWRVFLGLRCS